MSSRKSKNKQGGQKKPKQQNTMKMESKLPTIISAKTGLTPKDDALMKKLPESYLTKSKTIGDALDYLLGKKKLEAEEKSLAKSIKEEMRADDFVVVVNGKNAELSDKIVDYVIKKEHELPDKQVKTYNELEIEISSVQEGGFYRFH